MKKAFLLINVALFSFVISAGCKKEGPVSACDSFLRVTNNCVLQLRHKITINHSVKSMSLIGYVNVGETKEFKVNIGALRIQTDHPAPTPTPSPILSETPSPSPTPTPMPVACADVYIQLNECGTAVIICSI